MAVLNFFPIQKLNFGPFWNCKKWSLVKKISWNWFIWFYEFFWPGLFQIGWYLPVLSGLAGSVPDHFGVNGAWHAVVQLGIQLWKYILGVHRSVRNISDSGSLHDVANHKLSDGFVLGASLAAVRTTDILDMSTTMLGTSIILPLLSHVSEPEDKKIVFSFR